jgi:outer membrane receptor protein involved in Fe transport
VQWGIAESLPSPLPNERSRLQEDEDLKTQTIKRRLLHSTMIGSAALMALTAVPAVALLAPTVASAQDYTSGNLSGTVRDDSGAPIAGATVSATSGQGATRSTTTDANGTFRLSALAVGGYAVTIAAPQGTATQVVSVSPGGASYDFVVVGDAATSLDDVVVTATRVQDFNATDTGMSVDVQEFADRVPTGRSINAVTLFAPGASAPDATIAAGSRRNQSLVSLSGTSAAESVYYINGMNVTDQRSFLGYGELPFDFIQTIDTKTGGYQAEYGRATGGVVNIVTRSGANEWTGGFSTFFTPDSLRASRGVSYRPGGSAVAGIEDYNQFSSAEVKDYTAYLGGPLWRDHLFFFGVYNVRDVEQESARSRSFAYSTSTGAITPGSTLSQSVSAYDDPRWAVKLDLVVNPDHRLEATFINDKTTTVSRTRTFSAATGDQTAITDPLSSEAGGLTEIYKYTGVFADWFTLSALYGKQENAYLDFGNPTSLPGVLDNAAPGGARYLTAGRPALYNLGGGDVRKTYRVDADLYLSLFGDHHFRIGWDKEELTSVADNAYSGGSFYNVLAQGSCPTGAGASGCIERQTFANRGTFQAEQTALYIQDSWDITPDFSVQLGVRNDRYDYLNAAGDSYVAIDDQWAPRLGFNWDPTGQGVSRVYGSVGDYYLPIATNTSIRASSGEIFTYEYYQATRDGAGNLVLNGNAPQLGARYDIAYLSPPGTPAKEQVAEADLKPMYEREFVLGYEHRFEDGMFADWSAGVRYVNRNLESAIEDTQIGDAVARYCIRNNLAICVVTDGADTYTPADGTDFAGYFNYALINPGDGATVLVDLQADPRTLSDGSVNPDYNPQLINFTAADMNLQEVERTYQALEFTFERPFDGSWGLQGSYTLAESRGNYEGAVKSDIGQLDTSITQDYDHAANQLGANGYLPNHHRHTFKLFGSWAPTDRLGVGANFTAQSGRRFGCIGRVPLSIDPLAPTAGTPSGWYCPLGPNNSTIQTPRGSQGETNWTYQMDLNFNLALFETPDRGSLSASLDIFNVFDADTAARVVEQGLIRTSANRMDARAPYYGMARSYQAPRTVRVGLRYRF